MLFAVVGRLICDPFVIVLAAAAGVLFLTADLSCKCPTLFALPKGTGRVLLAGVCAGAGVFDLGPGFGFGSSISSSSKYRSP